MILHDVHLSLQYICNNNRHKAHDSLHWIMGWKSNDIHSLASGAYPGGRRGGGSESLILLFGHQLYTCK